MVTPIRKYAFINAKLRARISKLLPDSLLVQMTRAYSLQEALSLLRDTPYSTLDDIYRKTGDLKLGELELLKDEIRVYTEVEKYAQDDTLVMIQAFLSLYEIENLKNALRIFFDRKIRRREVDTAVLYLLKDPILHDIPIDLIINAENLGEIADALEATPYAHIIHSYGEAVIREGSLFRLEIAFDHYYYTNLISTAEKLDSRDRKDALRIIGVEIDLVNINWIIRFRQFYNLPLEEVLSLTLPGGHQLKSERLQQAYTSQNVTQLLQDILKSDYPGLGSLLSTQATDSISRLLLIERILEQILMHETRRILMGYPFTIGIVLSYFIFKKNEIKKIRSILNAKQYRIPEDRIEDVI
jgi:V/A-type H+-transporting ATPase subunit C